MISVLAAGGVLFWTLLAVVIVRRGFRKITRQARGARLARQRIDLPGRELDPLPLERLLLARAARGAAHPAAGDCAGSHHRPLHDEPGEDAGAARRHAGIGSAPDGGQGAAGARDLLGVRAVDQAAASGGVTVQPSAAVPAVLCARRAGADVLRAGRVRMGAAARSNAYPIIQAELQQVLAADGKGFKAYVSEHNQRLTGWNTFNLFFYGQKVEENCAQCPRTTAVLESLPRFERDHIMFSALNPHSHIPAHVGPINGIIRAHLGLVVPDGCFIKVGDQERTWEQGRLLLFDDSFRHEVWNHSDQVRIVLFMNFWHPCFLPEEIPVLDRYRRAYEETPFSRVHQDNQARERGHDLAPVVAHA